MKNVYIEAVNTKEQQTSKAGKPYWPMGIKVDNTWYNGVAFDLDQVKSVKAESHMTLNLYEEEYNGKMYKKFKLPPKSQMHVAELEARVAKLEKAVFNNTAKPEPEKPAAAAELDVDDLPF